jgi:hypothetical protein
MTAVGRRAAPFCMDCVERSRQSSFGIWDDLGIAD